MGIFRKKNTDNSEVDTKDSNKWQLPSLDLLDEITGKNTDNNDSVKDLERTVTQIVNKFGCSAELELSENSPRIYKFKFKPTNGNKVQDKDKLHRALAQELDTDRIRLVVESELNGRIYVELPKSNPETVWLKEALQSEEYKESDAPLSVPIGKGSNGKFEIVDLHKISPIIAAGQTGSGKSNFTETALVLSLIYRNTPDELKLILIDPKIVQFPQYEGIPHLLQPPITHPDEAKKVFEWLLKEMSDRFKTLSQYGLKKIEDYKESDMPNLVIIIDEVADLMMIDPEFYSYAFKKLSMMARGAGIHLYMGTSRPSDDVFPEDVIVGFFSRFAFTMASMVDSEKIIHASGAEHLLGQGDLLYLDLTTKYPIRVQAPFSTEEAMSRVADFWRKQS